MVAPVLQEASSLGDDAPVIGVGIQPPAIDLLAYPVDDGSVIVALSLGAEALALVKRKLDLLGCTLLLLRLGGGRDELVAAPGLEDLVCRLTCLVQLPVA
jgi:hypothetical protein